MHLIDEFFDAPDWETAVPALMQRHTELLDRETGEALNRAVGELATNEAAAQILRYYEFFLAATARKDLRAMHAFLQGQCPKLTTQQLHALGQVQDVSTARQFLQRWPEAWTALLMQQVVQGEAFWQLLLASARLVKQGSRFTEPVKTTVVVAHDDSLKRIFKLLPLSDGGFAATMPYHGKRSGSLMKMLIPRVTGTLKVPMDQTMPFSASDRVKLSYHADGFVQFSGEISSRIISGRDSDGTPRGLGLMSNSLHQPVQSGPSVGCAGWGLAEFEPWIERPSEAALVFASEADFYVEPRADDEVGTDGETTMAPETPGISFSIFPFPAAILEQAVGPYGTGDEMEMRLPMNIYLREAMFRVKLVRMGPQVGLGVIAKSELFNFGLSGFSLSGPGDGKHNMQAVYPGIPLGDEATSLDYRPAA